MKRSDYYFLMLAIYVAPKMPDTPAALITVFYLVCALWSWNKEIRAAALKGTEK